MGRDLFFNSTRPDNRDHAEVYDSSVTLTAKEVLVPQLTAHTSTDLGG
jgi:hypothetical protein